MLCTYLVDDNKDFIELFSLNVQPSWKLKVFDNPIEALKAAHQDKPIIIMSDAMMGPFHGLDFLTLCSLVLPDTFLVCIFG